RNPPLHPYKIAGYGFAYTSARGEAVTRHLFKSSLAADDRFGSYPPSGLSGRSAVELARHGHDGEHGLGRLQRWMEMRAFQPRDRPSPPSRFQGCVVINRRALNERGWNMVPAGEFDRVVEPVERQPR